MLAVVKTFSPCGNSEEYAMVVLKSQWYARFHSVMENGDGPIMKERWVDPKKLKGEKNPC